MKTPQVCLGSRDGAFPEGFQKTQNVTNKESKLQIKKVQKCRKTYVTFVYLKSTNYLHSSLGRWLTPVKGERNSPGQ